MLFYFILKAWNLPVLIIWFLFSWWLSTYLSIMHIFLLACFFSDFSPNYSLHTCTLHSLCSLLICIMLSLLTWITRAAALCKKIQGPPARLSMRGIGQLLPNKPVMHSFFLSFFFLASLLSAVIRINAGVSKQASHNTDLINQSIV